MRAEEMRTIRTKKDGTRRQDGEQKGGEKEMGEETKRSRLTPKDGNAQ